MHSSQELVTIRTQIDQIDNEIVPLLVRRIALALRACQFKQTAQEVKGEERVQQVLAKVTGLAREIGGHEETIQAIYHTIIAELTKLQLAAKGLRESE